MASHNHKIQQLKSERERRMFTTSDDNAMMKQVMATHAPDDREIEVGHILHIIEDILRRATPTVVVAPETSTDMVDEVNSPYAGLSLMLEALAYTIHRIACELSCKCSGGVDGHTTTMSLLNTLTSYSWESKLVLALAAFAMSYGEFWLTAQLQAINPLAKSVALLKQLPDMLEGPDVLKPRFEALNGLIRAMIAVTKTLILLKELPTEYISMDIPALSMALSHFPTAVYWTIRGVVACSAQIISLIGVGHEYVASATEAWELSTLAHKVNNIHDHLRKQLGLCQQYIDEKVQIETYKNIIRVTETIHMDNSKILRTLFPAKDDMPFIECPTKKRVSVEVLKRKIVILLISDLDLSLEELGLLVDIYMEEHAVGERRYEVVWIPVVDTSVPWTDAKQEMFIGLGLRMPWYSLVHPSLLEHATVRFIKEVWHFTKTPMLVVLDPQGRVVWPNALHMMRIWGSLAYPFSSSKEEALWRDEIWRLELLVDNIDPKIAQWMEEDKIICLYGGEDIDWIRKFTSNMRMVCDALGIGLEMLYVGKSDRRERVRKTIDKILDEKLSACWDLPFIWYFWIRLGSMWYSKDQLGRDDDPVMQEVTAMLSFDSGDEGWAVIWRGSTAMVKSSGKKMNDCLEDYQSWRARVKEVGFIEALRDALDPYHTTDHCIRLILPGSTGKMREQIICAECKRPMDMFFLYRCCKD